MLALFRRFLTERWALALVLLFVAVPIGALFGTTFIQYAKLAAKGFADPAAYIFFFCALLPLIDDKARSKFFGALLLALAIFMKPVVAPAAAVLIGGRRPRRALSPAVDRGSPRSASASCRCSRWRCTTGSMATSSCCSAPMRKTPTCLVMPPSAYVAAARDMLHLDFSGAGRVVVQLANWLSGPAESYWTIPLNAAGVAILIYVVVRGRRFDPYLRLIGAAGAGAAHGRLLLRRGRRPLSLPQLVPHHAGGAWSFLHEVGVDWLRAALSRVWRRSSPRHPLSRRLASGLTRLQKSAA